MMAPLLLPIVWVALGLALLVYSCRTAEPG